MAIRCWRSAIAWFFGRSLTGLFVSGGSSAQLVELAQTYMITNVLAYPLLTLVNVVRFMIQGMGFSMFAILAGVMEMAARSLAGMFLVPALGYFGAALGSPLAWVAADLFLVPAYFRVPPRADEPVASSSRDGRARGTELNNFAWKMQKVCIFRIFCKKRG